MTRINPHRAGFVVGVLLVVVHAVWLGIVALGGGQAVGDFVLRTHMMEPGMQVQPFSATDGALLLVMAAVVGYGLGAFSAAVWNVSAWLESRHVFGWLGGGRQSAKHA